MGAQPERPYFLLLDFAPRGRQTSFSDLYSLETSEDFLNSEAQDNRTPVRTGERVATVEQFIDKPLHFFAGQRGVDLDGCTAR